MKAALSTGISMFYEETGRGEPLVLIAGTSLGHEAWHLQLPAFAPGFRTIAVDHRGSGQTSAPEDPNAYSARIMADDIAALLDVLKIERAHIAGMSLGSAIAQEMALNHADRVLSIQLHATWGRTDAWFRQAFVDPMLHFLKAKERRLAFKFGQALIMSPDYLNSRGPAPVAEMVDRCLIKNPHLASDAGFGGQLHADATHDTLDRLGTIRVPTLITAGELDMNTPYRYGEQVHAAIGHSAYHFFRGPRSSHVAMWEMADEFNRVCLDFLRSTKIR